MAAGFLACPPTAEAARRVTRHDARAAARGAVQRGNELYFLAHVCGATSRHARRRRGLARRLDVLHHARFEAMTHAASARRRARLAALRGRQAAGGATARIRARGFVVRVVLDPDYGAVRALRRAMARNDFAANYTDNSTTTTTVAPASTPHTEPRAAASGARRSIRNAPFVVSRAFPKDAPDGRHAVRRHCSRPTVLDYSRRAVKSAPTSASRPTTTSAPRARLRSAPPSRSAQRPTVRLSQQVGIARSRSNLLPHVAWRGELRTFLRSSLLVAEDASW